MMMRYISQQALSLSLSASHSSHWRAGARRLAGTTDPRATHKHIPTRSCTRRCVCISLILCARFALKKSVSRAPVAATSDPTNDDKGHVFKSVYSGVETDWGRSSVNMLVRGSTKAWADCRTHSPVRAIASKQWPGILVSACLNAPSPPTDYVCFKGS